MDYSAPNENVPKEDEVLLKSEESKKGSNTLRVDAKLLFKKCLTETKISKVLDSIFCLENLIFMS